MFKGLFLPFTVIFYMTNNAVMQVKCENYKMQSAEHRHCKYIVSHN